MSPKKPTKPRNVSIPLVSRIRRFPWALYQSIKASYTSLATLTSSAMAAASDRRDRRQNSGVAVEQNPPCGRRRHLLQAQACLALGCIVFDTLTFHCHRPSRHPPLFRCDSCEFGKYGSPSHHRDRMRHSTDAVNDAGDLGIVHLPTFGFSVIPLNRLFGLFHGFTAQSCNRTQYHCPRCRS